MTRYQLAKIVEWAGKLQTRKRLQKVVFLLQAKGCPLDVEFTLHHYGPYSQEVARISDEMAQTDLLEEESGQNNVGVQYSYVLTEHARQRIADLESTTQGHEMAAQLAPFKQLADELIKTDLRELEVAATAVYFRLQQQSWPEAIEKTCKFKNIVPRSSFVEKIENLARRIID